MANVQKKRVEKNSVDHVGAANAAGKCISFDGLPIIQEGISGNSSSEQLGLDKSVANEQDTEEIALQNDGEKASLASEIDVSSDINGDNNKNNESESCNNSEVSKVQPAEDQKEQHACQEQAGQDTQQNQQNSQELQEQQSCQEQQPLQEKQDNSQDTIAINEPDDDIAAEEFISKNKSSKQASLQRKHKYVFTQENNNIDGNPGTISELLDKQKDFFKLGTSVKADWRKTALGRLHSLIDKYETPLIEAIHRDLGITRYEAYLTELAPIHAEFKVLRKNIEKFCASQKMGVEKDLLPTSFIECWQPHGTVCIINSWESPVAMSVILLAEAIAAGNTVVLKNSGRTKRCNEVLATAFDELFKPDYVRFVFGGADMDAVLLSTRFNKFCYVGSKKNSPIVYEASTNACAPTMLLNNNNACFIDSTANIETAAEKIMWGKMIHAGQTRYTPHYAMVSDAVYKTFINRTFGYIEHTYGDDAIHAKGYPRMFSRTEFDQACELLDSIGSKARIVYGGERDIETLRIAPTVILCDSIDNPLFKRPITGPILVVGTFGRAEDAFEQINQLPTPPAFYMFSKDKDTQEFAMRNAQFGQGCINDCMMQIINRKGSHSSTGTSGMGTIGAMRGLEEFGTRRIMAVSGEGSSLKSWRKTPFPLEGYDKVKKVFKFFTSQK